MVNNAAPSNNPTNTDSLLGTLNLVLDKFLARTDDMLPARVVAFDRVKNRAQVQPLISMVSTSGERVTRAPIASVPVFQIGGGGFILNFNLKPGDLGWIKANDRDISLFLQSYSEQQPNTKRKHSFEDALFIPDVMHNYTIEGEDAENAVLQNLDGTVRVAIWDDRVKITAPRVDIVAPTINMTGAITTVGTITNNGKNIGSTHVHSGVMTGGSNTGAPT